MPARKPALDRTKRRALQHLARAAPEGTTEMVMLMHGFPGELLVELVTAGLATATVHANGDRSADATWLRITEAGRNALTPSSRRREL
jgi:hypothetical protein